MNPGRELDALIAEKVMGQPKEWFYHNSELLPSQISKYSTDITAAFEVVDRIGLVRLVNGPDGWLCCFGICGLNEWGGATLSQVEGRGKSAPLAICAAALKAVGYEPAKIDSSPTTQ